MSAPVWYPVARSDDLPLRHVFHGQLHGVELALWRADDGAVNAWENRCPHRSVRFTLGVNTGNSLRCQYHGWQYRSGDGRCIAIPAAAAGRPPASLCSRAFAVVEARGYVFVHSAFAGIPDDLPTCVPLPLALRSVAVNAPVDMVAAMLHRYDDAGATLHREGHTIDLAWTDGRHVRFWLQPADTGRTIIHGSTSPGEAGARETLVECNRALTALCRRIEAAAPAPLQAAHPFIEAARATPPRPAGHTGGAP